MGDFASVFVFKLHRFYFVKMNPMGVTWVAAPKAGVPNLGYMYP